MGKHTEFSLDGDWYGAAYVAASQAFDRVHFDQESRNLHMEDAKQEAVMGMLRCGDGRSRPYVFVAARRQVLAYVFHFVFSDKTNTVNDTCPRFDLEELNERTLTARTSTPEQVLIEREEEAEREGVFEQILDLLHDIMRESRVQKTGRAMAAADRDAMIVYLSLRGYTPEGIAHELGDTLRNVQCYLRTARIVLGEYLENLGGNNDD